MDEEQKKAMEAFLKDFNGSKEDLPDDIQKIMDDNYMDLLEDAEEA